MSEQEPNEPYIYQPFGFQHEMGKRLYGIGGLHTLGFPYGTKVDGFTSEEASKILTVIKNFLLKSRTEPNEERRMKDIKFKQFLFPGGREKEAIIERPEPIADRAEVLQDYGFSLEIENQGGQVWMSCVNHETEESFDRICDNGPDVPLKIDEMINEAFEKTQARTEPKL
jgi:hypothetical protein